MARQGSFQSNNNRNKNKKTNLSFMSAVTRSVLCELVVCIMLIMGGAFLLNYLSDPDRYIPALCLLCCAASGFAGGISFKKYALNASFAGIVLCGAAFTAILFLTSLFFDKTQPDNTTGFKIILAVLPPLFSFIGGRTAKSSKKHRKLQ